MNVFSFCISLTHILPHFSLIEFKLENFVIKLQYFIIYLFAQLPNPKFYNTNILNNLKNAIGFHFML